jgi:hypothetical protein
VRTASLHAISSEVVEMALHACEVEGIDSAMDVAFLEHVPMPSLVALFKGKNAVEAAQLLHLASLDVAACKAEWAEHAIPVPCVPTASVVVALPQRRPLKKRKVVMVSSSIVAPRMLESLYEAYGGISSESGRVHPIIL